MKKSAKQSMGKGESGRDRGSIDILGNWHVLHVYVACGIAFKVEIQHSKQARKINDYNHC